MSIQSDRLSYSGEDEVTIAGRVTDMNRLPVEGAEMSIEVIDQLSNIVHEGLTYTGEDGTYSDRYVLSTNAEPGVYTVFVRASKQDASLGENYLQIAVSAESLQMFKLSWEESEYSVLLRPDYDATMQFDQKNKKFTLVAGSDSKLKNVALFFPKDLLDGPFEVVADGGTIDFSLATNASHNSLSIFNNREYNEISVIGTTVIPEFIDMLLLTVILPLGISVMLFASRFMTNCRPR